MISDTTNDAARKRTVQIKFIVCISQTLKLPLQGKVEKAKKEHAIVPLTLTTSLKMH
jgi:hypothetical protein